MKLVFFILLFTSFEQKDEVYIWFPNDVGVVQTCNGKDAEILIEITTESNKKIKVHSFNLDKSNFTIYKDDEAFKEIDTLILTKKNPIKLKVRYKISLENSKKFTFKTNVKKYLNNQVNIFYGQHIITTKDIRESKEQFINITESCQDSIMVFFPYGGTISSATLYNDSSSTKKIYKSVSYDLMEEGNSITFTKADLGRYFVDFGSCHWGGEFWLTIK
ncbi:hypothetical protein [Flavobacterium filum]|uniref:hypothetical protein n=1 Tax=Flavobacterium filum TaxID=370974 RepID=UPI00146EDA3F|nr:hypothetical protein [Flavobacterium filum]